MLRQHSWHGSSWVPSMTFNWVFRPTSCNGNQYLVAKWPRFFMNPKVASIGLFVGIQNIKITSGCNDVVWIHLKTLQIWLWISDWINLLAILMFENNIIFEHVWKCPNWCDVRPSHVPSLGWSRPVGRECNYRTRFHSHHKRGIAPNAPCRQLPFQSTYAQQFFR